MISAKPLKLPDYAAKRWIFWGVPAIFAIGVFNHYVFDLLGRLNVAGIFAPINESVWEHLKLAFWPTILWWAAGYCLLAEKNKVSASQWMISSASAALLSPAIILGFYYTYTWALGIESLFLDVFSLLLATALSQGVAYRLYKNKARNRFFVFTVLLLFILAAFAFGFFTFYPPHIPLFRDPPTGTYGIWAG
ncbi:MAG: DUF6512 family protein [Bacillota bacterium]|nr:DUF6512 family protein [Bacillota bacterium]